MPRCEHNDVKGFAAVRLCVCCIGALGLLRASSRADCRREFTGRRCTGSATSPIARRRSPGFHRRASTSVRSMPSGPPPATPTPIDLLSLSPTSLRGPPSKPIPADWAVLQRQQMLETSRTLRSPVSDGKATANLAPFAIRVIAVTATTPTSTAPTNTPVVAPTPPVSAPPTPTTGATPPSTGNPSAATPATSSQTPAPDPALVNHGPAVSGTPPAVIAGSAYAFTPSATDIDGDPLTFAISNRPARPLSTRDREGCRYAVVRGRRDLSGHPDRRQRRQQAE